MHRAMVEMAENIKAENKLDAKRPNEQPYSSWTLSFTAKEAETAQQMLSAYIQFVTAKVQQDILERLQNKVQYKLALEKRALALALDALNNERDVKIQRLKYALNIAHAAGIKRPVYSEGQSVQDDPDFSITLGADGIAAKLEVEKSLRDMSAISMDIRNRENRIAQMTRLTIPRIEVQPFKFMLSPSLPVKHDGPGRLPVILLITLLGGLLASLSVLIRKALSLRHD